MKSSLQLVVLLSAALVAACASDTSQGATGNTELSLDIVNPGGTSGELAFSVDRVDYRITCAGGAYLLPPFHANPSAPNGNECSTADLDNNGVPDACPAGFNYISGTAGPDNLTGTNGNDCIFGLGGNDIIDGRNGGDYICGGSGADTLTGGNGNDSIFGGDGADNISGGNGNDVAIGDGGDDALDAGSGNDLLGGGPGVDTLDGNAGTDTCAEEVPGTSTRLTACESSYSDSVDISGAFEVVDTRVPPVWQAVMDLPPGDCTVTLSVYEDDEIVCAGSQTLAIAEDATTKYDIVLVCSLSIDTPDGMADIDGTFEFITGNLCPKLYILNAIEYAPFSTSFSGGEIQYRAKDPDNSCGNNCDPQSCTNDNPPICTPYPSNISDPACNPSFGGDPNSPDCLAGVYSGLVCTITAIPLATGTPGGTFISPSDGVTPVGPVLPVNLNLASGVPGIILPGLGGPAGTNAANSPGYPPLPNVNGSLPPLIYQCDDGLNGPTVINLVCSDGDLECDQQKQVQITCGTPDYCIDVPVDCSSSGECLTDGSCNYACDPAASCDRCIGRDDPRPVGTLCTEGGGNVCDGAGACVECINDAACLSILPPVECQLDPTCVSNSCVAGGAAPAGTPCNYAVCDGAGIGSGSCYFVEPGLPQSTLLTMGCTNNVTADISILPFELTVYPGPIISNTPTSAEFSGTAVFSEVFLDAAQGAVPGGVTQADLVNLVATVQIRTGGTLAGPVALTNAPIPTTCLIGGGACNPANDGASVPGSQPNTDCVPTGTFNPCQALVSIPTSSDCAPGGVCDGLGKLASQCSVNGFCVTGGLPLPLASQTVGFTPAASGIVNFGFADQGTGATVLPNGAYSLPAAVFTAPQTLNEIKVNASGLSVALRCTMAVDAGGPNGPVPPVPDQASPTPTSQLITFNIQVP